MASSIPWRNGLPDLRAARRFAIIKLSSIGDVVHALPVAAALGRAYPHLELTWIAEEIAAPLLAGNSFLHDVVVLSRGWRHPSMATARQFVRLRRALVERRFDVTLDLQALTKSAVVAWATGAPVRLGYDWLRELAPLIERRIPRRDSSLHIVDQLLDTARALGAPADRVEFPLPDSAALTERARVLLAQAGLAPGEEFLVVNPTTGGHGGHKGWGVGRLQGLVDALSIDPGYRIVLVGAASELSVGRALEAESRVRPLSLIGQTTLPELVGVIRRSRAHVSGDTGSAHIAAAVGVPTVCVFSRSNPVRVAPYGQPENVVHHRDQCSAACRRFHERAPLNSSQRCRTPPPRCLTAVSVEEVADRVRRATRQRSGAIAT